MLADGELARDRPRTPTGRLRAARVGLGALGASTRSRSATVPAFTLDRVDRPRRSTRCSPTSTSSPPRTTTSSSTSSRTRETALCRESRRTDEPPRAALAGDGLRPGGHARELGRRRPSRRSDATCPRTSRGWPGSPPAASGARRRSTAATGSSPAERRIRFTEMEYGIPREHARRGGAPRARARRATRSTGSPIPDRGPLRRRRRRRCSAPPTRATPATSPSTRTARLRLGALLPRRRGDHGLDYGGRPHWGKRHFQTAETLAPRYPRFDDFLALRDRLDPDGVLPTPTPSACWVLRCSARHQM